MSNTDPEKLRNWFLKFKRDFPWRKQITPYRVWISEIMLQQTRANVVVDYFEKWMDLFPDIASLSMATEEMVVKAWEGLGYYSRARNVLKAAKYFMSNYHGSIPQSKELLIKAPGLGEYTVGAILSFAFGLKHPAVDANVIRVISRYCNITEEISPKSIRKIQVLTENFLPDINPAEVMEGLIELGASVCGKKPKCEICPIKKGCVSYSKGTSNELPVLKKNKQTIKLFKDVIVLKCEECFLLLQKPKGKVLAGLYEFPSFDKRDDIELIEFIKKTFDLNLSFKRFLPKQNYSYTHHAVELFPSLWETTSKIDVPGHYWKTISEAFSLPFSSGHKRILINLLEGIEK